MASIEFLNERITKAEEFITKRTSTIERKQSTIVKKIASLKKMGVEYSEDIDARNYRDNYDVFWTIYDIESLTDDISRAKKDIVEKQKSLDEYKAQLQSEVEKANSRNIPAILEFLEGWKSRVMQYYKEQFDEYLDARHEFYEQDRKYCEWYNLFGYKTRRENPEEYKQKETEHRHLRDAFQRRWNFLFPYTDNYATYLEFNEAKLQKDLDLDANAKYDFIVERTNAIVGTITDATNLRVGDKGDLNGYIIGERGRAKVETIGAGGYNIQCYHFRTLIHAMK